MDFHNMIGKLRAIESLGDKTEYVAEDAPESAIAGKCNMTAEGKSCPVHGMVECWSAPMEENDAATLESMLKNSGQLAEAGAPPAPATRTPTAQDSGETWADWFSRIYGGSQTVATGGEIQGADTSGGVSGNPAGDFTGDPNSTPTSVKPVVEPTVAARPSMPAGSLPAANRLPTRPGQSTSGPAAPAVGGARPEAPAAGMPAAKPAAAPEPATFKDAFRAARKAAGGAGGVFMWKGKPYQTNVKGEPSKAWNSPELKKVGSGWPTSESAGRKMKATKVNEAESGGTYSPTRPLPTRPGQSTSGPITKGMPTRPGQSIRSPRISSIIPDIAGNPTTLPNRIGMGMGKFAASVVNPAGTVAGGDTRMGAASTGLPPKTAPVVPASIGKPTGLSIEYNDEEWYQFTSADGKIRYVGGDSGLANKATRARLRAIMKADPVQFNRNNSAEAEYAIGQLTQADMSESVDRLRELAGIGEVNDSLDTSVDQLKVDDMASSMSKDVVDEMDKVSPDMTIDDLMRKYGVEDEVNEDAPLNGMPFTSLGATNNGPEEWGMVVTGGTSTNNFNENKNLKEGFTINSNMDVRDGKVTKSLSINATDDDVDTLATMLRNAGMGEHSGLRGHSDICDDCGKPEDQCNCGMNQTPMCDACDQPLDSCSCEMTMENADHDYGHDEKSEIGEPLDVEEYVWDGPHLNQRFGKIGDNTLMAERAITLFKNYSDQYTQMLEEADLVPSNAGFDSPLTANSRDEFDKDPFVDETPVDDGSRSPLSTVKRQDVMEQIRKLAKILEATHALYRMKVLAEAATKDDAAMLTRIIENFQSKSGISITGVLDKSTRLQLEAALNTAATPAVTNEDLSSQLAAQIAKRDAQKAYKSANWKSADELNAPKKSAAQQAHDELYAKQMSDPASMGWKEAEPTTYPGSDVAAMPSFPSMGVANTKLDYYQPGEEAMIAGQSYIRDIDAQNNKVWRLRNASDAPSEYQNPNM